MLKALKTIGVDIHILTARPDKDPTTEIATLLQDMRDDNDEVVISQANIHWVGGKISSYNNITAASEKTKWMLNYLEGNQLQIDSLLFIDDNEIYVHIAKRQNIESLAKMRQIIFNKLPLKVLRKNMGLRNP